jgi:hypothetical protein
MTPLTGHPDTILRIVLLHCRHEETFSLRQRGWLQARLAMCDADGRHTPFTTEERRKLLPVALAWAMQHGYTWLEKGLRGGEA